MEQRTTRDGSDGDRGPISEWHFAEGPGEKANAAITKLLITHRASLFAYILACVRNYADAEEVFQEVSVAIVSSFHKLRSADGFLPWAREIARRQVLAYYRRSSRPMVYDTELVGLLVETANRMDAEAGDGRGDALRLCLETLPEQSRKLLIMRYGGSYNGVDEIAEALGRTMAATYGLLKRVRIALRKCVDTRLQAEPAT